MDIEKALGRKLPFAKHLGIRLITKGGGKARLELDVRPELMNSCSLDAAEKGAITVELKVNFVGPGLGTLVADGRCVHAGKTVAFCEGEVHDTSGKLVATASGTFMLRR